MKKKIKDLTFAEAKEICDKHNFSCKDCPLQMKKKIRLDGWHYHLRVSCALRNEYPDEVKKFMNKKIKVEQEEDLF